MKDITHKRVKIIHATDAATFEAEINKVLEQFPSAEIRLNETLDKCVITYTFTEELPESARDKFAMQGIYYHCRNCPHMEPPQDGRFKWCGCDITPYGRTHMDTEACEYFYKALLTGEIRRSEILEDRR